MKIIKFASKQSNKRWTPKKIIIKLNEHNIMLITSSNKYLNKF